MVRCITVAGFGAGKCGVVEQQCGVLPAQSAAADGDGDVGGDEPGYGCCFGFVV